MQKLKKSRRDGRGDRAKTVCLTALAGLIALSLMGCRNQEEEQKRFDAFLQSEFVTKMEEEYTALHAYLQDPEAYGIPLDRVKAGLGTYPDEEGINAQKESVQASYDALHDFNRNLLTETQKDIYDSYAWQLGLEREASEDIFDYYEPLFGSMTGVHYQIPTLLADWEVRDEKEVNELIAVVYDVKPYVESALEYTRKQGEQGSLMVDTDSVIRYCSAILEKGEDSSILASMCENISQAGLDEEKTNEYQSQLKTAFVESVLPAYEEICDAMTAFSSGDNNEEGLAKLEHGKAYYEIIFQQSIGSEQSVEEVREWMEEELEQHMKQGAAILLNDPSLGDVFYSDDFAADTGYSDYYEMMDAIKVQMTVDFPEVGQLDYVIKEINEEIASDSGVTAYFNIPTLDGESVKQLRVNPKTNDITSLSTYQTVAHEGFPGHMYQYAYMYETLDTPFQKAVLTNSAYTEGYATYVQYEANKYLDDMEPDLLELYKQNDLINDCLVILLDIGIHYDGWSKEEAGDYVRELGFEIDEAGMDGLYGQLQANPCAFEPYYVGYFMIETMKEKAQEALGSRFDNKKFHEALLKSGTAPFSVVEKNINAYIEEAKND